MNSAECIAKCAAESPLAIWLPAAYAALSLINGALHIRGSRRPGMKRALDLLGDFLDLVSFHTRKNGRGTLKLPGVRSKDPAL